MSFDIHSPTDRADHAPDLLESAKAHVAARQALDDANVANLTLHDPRFAAVTDTLADLIAALAKASPQSPSPPSAA